MCSKDDQGRPSGAWQGQYEQMTVWSRKRAHKVVRSGKHHNVSNTSFEAFAFPFFYFFLELPMTPMDRPLRAFSEEKVYADTGQRVCASVGMGKQQRPTSNLKDSLM